MGRGSEKAGDRKKNLLACWRCGVRVDSAGAGMWMAYSELRRLFHRLAIVMCGRVQGPRGPSGT